MATTTNNAAENTTNDNAAVEAKPVSKMEHAKKLYAEIFTPGYKLKEGTTSQRAEFIRRAIDEFGMTKAGAGTYYQNLSNKDRGQPLYKYNSKKAGTKAEVKEGEANATTVTGQANAALDQKPSNDRTDDEGTIGQYRWTCKNEAGEEVASFPTRSKAQEFAKAGGLIQGDRKEEAKAE